MSNVYNPWDAFDQGGRIGARMRGERQQAELGTAYEDGGLDAVADRAAGQGDLATSNTAHTMARRREEEPMTRLRQFGGFATSALRRAQQLPPERRGEWLSQPHIRQRFEVFGFQPQQIDNAIQHLSNPETAEEMFANLYSAFQGDGLDWSVMDPATGQIGAIEPNTGEYVEGGQAPIPPPGEVHQFGSGGLYRNDPRAPNGIQIIREPRAVGGDGSGGGRAPSGYRWNADGAALEPIPGGPRDPESQGARPFPADQRARVAISFEPALEAAQQMERAEAFAVRRQGTHGSDTPFGQDWLARWAEAVPFDGGSAARMIGGEDYQQYTRSSSAFEAAILPILSGAAVTESEAQRIVRAALPRHGDDTATLASKARQRRQMLNGAALIGGRPIPYPEDSVADWASRANSAVQSVPDLGGVGDGIPQGEYPPDYDPNDVTTWPDWALEGG